MFGTEQKLCEFKILVLTDVSLIEELDSPQPNLKFAWKDSKAQNLRYQHLQDEAACVGCMQVLVLLCAPNSLFCKKQCNVCLLVQRPIREKDICF